MRNELDQNLVTLIHRIRCATAETKFSLALRALGSRHWEDEPRIPRGQHGGGRWTTAVNVTATLLDQRVGVGEKGLVRHCTYIDPDGNMTTRVLDATLLCPPTIEVRKRYE